jgi:hypothetical protein
VFRAEPEVAGGNSLRGRDHTSFHEDIVWLYLM